MSIKENIRDIKDKIKNAISYIKEYDRQHPRMIFVVIAILGCILVWHPFREDSLIAYYKVKSKKSQLQRDLQKAKEHYKKDSTRLINLKNDANALERVAREDYLMKAPGETIFIIKETENNEDK